MYMSCCIRSRGRRNGRWWWVKKRRQDWRHPVAMVSSQSSPSFSCLGNSQSVVSYRGTCSWWQLQFKWGWLWVLLPPCWRSLQSPRYWDELCHMHATTKFLSLMCQPSIDVVVGPGTSTSTKAVVPCPSDKAALYHACRVCRDIYSHVNSMQILFSSPFIY